MTPPIGTPGLTAPLSAPNAGLTPLVGTGVGLQPFPVPQEELDKCKCPPKKKRDKSQSCTNPVVSRKVRDGFIYIKRKLQCLPSKRKSLSALV